MSSHVFDGILLRPSLKTERMTLKNKKDLLPPIDFAPPNTPSTKKKAVAFTENSGIQGALKWGGRDEDREGIRKRTSPPLKPKLSDSPSFRQAKFPKPDSSIYNLSWGPHLGDEERNENKETSREPSPQKGNQSPTKKTMRTSVDLLYHRNSPVTIEEPGSQSARLPNSRTLLKLRRPGALETLNAADRALSFIQKKQTKESKEFETILQYHHNRFDRIHSDNQSFALATARSEPGAYEPPTEEHGAQVNLDWRTKISKRIRDQYSDMIKQNESSVRNQVFNRNKDYYKKSENDLLVGIDLKRYHHAI